MMFACISWIRPAAAAPPIEPSAEHWFFRAPVKVAPPGVAGFERFDSPVDRFLAAEWKRHGLTPQAPADKGTLLRRVYLDLIGLPPLPDEIAAFEADASPDAYAKVVDRLLADPRYGPRWGRHFMDIWRYCDEMLSPCDKVTPIIGDYHLWNWRDWIIESVNANKPYDRMIQEMLAADELAPGDDNAIRATGYLVRNYNLLGERDAWLADTVDHTAQAFLGLTMKCCRCHDHKYDPLPQTDYYRMRAIFEPMNERLDFRPGTVRPRENGVPRAFDERPDAVTVRYISGNRQQPDRTTHITPGTPQMLHAGELAVQPVYMPVPIARPGRLPFVRSDRIAEVASSAEKAAAQLAALPPADDASPPADVSERRFAETVLSKAQLEQAAITACIAADDARDAQSPDAPILSARAMEAQRLFKRREAEADVAEATMKLLQATRDGHYANDPARAEPAKQKLAAEQMKLAMLAEEHAKPVGEYKSIWPEYPLRSSGRRLAFARWITSRQNPATARVLVNHVWMRHVGKPLVDTVFDFGIHGHAPTHPALLDALAVDFMESGWDLKRLHRTIVLSSAYQLSSARLPGSADEATDPENRYLWRMNSQPMQAEQVRDSVIFLSGKLDLSPGGPSVDPAKSDRVFRRSVYFEHTLDRGDRLMRAFDAADPNECYRRIESVVPQQALTMANSRLTFEHARLIAQSLSPTHTDDADFVHAAFLRVLCRTPAAGEAASCLNFLRAGAVPSNEPAAPAEKDPLVAASSDPAQRVRERLVQVLLNHTDFLTIR